MRRLSYTQLVLIDIYREMSRTDLIQNLRDTTEFMDDENLRVETEKLIVILEESTDIDYKTWQKEALGMDDSDAEEPDDIDIA